MYRCRKKSRLGSSMEFVDFELEHTLALQCFEPRLGTQIYVTDLGQTKKLRQLATWAETFPKDAVFAIYFYFNSSFCIIICTCLSHIKLNTRTTTAYHLESICRRLLSLMYW
ncbi:hypothetical protein BY458DRAFT_490236 [Sporodiniella umbellata]|nr:hypothetical protein BY458DRAFT_490236 [Sporodiniella umbellata]